MRPITRYTVHFEKRSTCLSKTDCNYLTTRVSLSLEIGFGTGLNALVTYKEHNALQLNIRYETVEAYPISWEEASQMNFSEVLSPTLSPIFKQMHCCPWNETVALSPTFSFKKRLQRFETINDVDTFDVFYFDAFWGASATRIVARS